MKNLREIKRKFILVLLVILFVMTGCNQQVQKAQESESQAEEKNSEKANMGFELPQTFGVLMPEYLLKGLSVHGSANLNSGEQIIKAEIDIEDLSKLEEGYQVFLQNNAQDIGLSGKLTQLPQDSAACEDGICFLEITLDEPAQVTSSVEAAIRLPLKEGVFYINKECILTDENGDTYVWVSLKEPQQITPDDWELRQVTLGETDGKRFEVLDGLTGEESLALMF